MREFVMPLAGDASPDEVRAAMEALAAVDGAVDATPEAAAQTPVPLSEDEDDEREGDA